MLVVLRKQKGFTQEDLARRLQTRQQVIQRIEKHPESASLGMLIRMTGELGGSLPRLLRYCSERRDAA